MLCGENVAICPQINKKHINTLWQNAKFLNFKPVGASHKITSRV
jgi:hypothetical protein